jgi:hypothetical protein
MRSFSATMLVLVVLAAVGCAGGAGSATMAPTVDVTGKWSGTWVGSGSVGSGMIEMTLKQTGSQYTGNLVVTGSLTDPSGFTQGVVSGNQVRIVLPSNLTGTLTAQGDSMTGDVQGAISAKVTLKRQM